MRRLTMTFLVALTFIAGSSFGQTQDFSYTDSWAKNGLQITNQKSDGVELIYSINNFSLTEKQIEKELLQTIELPGSFLPNDAGMPDVPGFGKYIALPQGAEAKLTVLEMRKEVIKNVDLAPAPVIPFASIDAPVKYEKNTKIYNADKPFPANPVKISDKSSIRGVDVVTLGITPFQYNPVKKELTIIRDIKLKVDFAGGNNTFGEERLRSMWFDPILQSNILNSGSLPKVDYTSRNLKDGTGWEYVIVIPDDADFAAWADTIKEFRTLQGIKTGVVTISDIGGNDIETIKDYFVDAYNNWDVPPAAVLIMADYGTSGLGITSKSYPHPYSGTYISDNYYADVVNDDALPDIAFARMTAQDANHLETMISKFKNYEMAPPTSADFYNHPITALGWQTERWFQICSEAIGGYFSSVHGKSPVRINAVYGGNPNTDPWSTATNTAQVIDYFGPSGQGYIPATPAELGGWTGGAAADVVNAINSGSFMLQHRDHGGEDGWGEPDFSNSNIDQLTNTGTNLPFIFSINCLTGRFDYSSECFAEKFHRYTYNGENSGALGLIAASQVSYSFVNDTYVWGLYDYMYPDFMPDQHTDTTNFNPMPSTLLPGFANVNGKYFLHHSSWPYNTGDKEITFNLFHLHGDAFTTLYSEVPEYLTVNHDGALLSSITQFNVQADEGAFIALTVDGEIIGTGVGTGSNEPITIEPQLPGNNVVITVTKQNHYRHSVSIPVIPPDGAYVVSDSIAVNDADANNNGRFDYGETIMLSMNAKNVGLEEATNVTVTIECEDEYLTILDNEESFGSIAADGESLVADAFQLEVTEDVPDNHSFNFTVSATDGDSIWTSYFNLNAYAPVLAIGDYYITNDDDGNGRLDPGETADLVIETMNNGHADCLEPIALLTANSPYFTILNERIILDPIAAQATQEVTFNVEANAVATNGTLVELMYKVSEISADSTDFNLTIGQPPEVTVGNGASEVSNYPFNTYYENNKSEMLYLGSELGAGEMLIQELAFDISTVGEIPTLTNLEINLKETDLTELGNSYPDMSGATTVFTAASYTMPTATGWHVFDIEDFDFDASNKNLIVEVIWGDNGAWNDAFKVNCTDIGTTMVTAGYADSETPPNYDENSSVRPNLKLYFAGDEADTTYTVTIEVLDTANNQPIPEAVVTVGSLSKIADANGQVTYDLMAADYRCKADADIYRMKANDITVTGEETFTILLLNNEGVGEMEIGNFKVFPNPATDRVKIESETVVEQVQIYNTFGSLVKAESVKSKDFVLDLANFKTGMYIINFQTAKGAKSYKIQIVK